MNPSVSKSTKLILFLILATTIVFTHDDSGNNQHQHSHSHHEIQDSNSHQHQDHKQQQHINSQQKRNHEDKSTHDHNHQVLTHSDVHRQGNNNGGKRQLQLKMIDSKPHLIETLQLAPITIFFYGSSSTPEYQEFAKVLPSYNDEFFSKVQTEVQFIFIPIEKFNLTRPNPSLSIYRKINKGQWLMYRGIFNKNQILKWITENLVDPLKELSGQDIDSFFVDGKKGFILLDFGQFYLLKTKIMIYQFCQQFQLFCGKISYTNKALNMIIQLMRVDKQPGIPKLGYWNPKSQQLEIYTKDVGTITQNELMQLYSGHESVIPYSAEIDVAKVIHPQTDIFEIKNHNEDLEL